MMTKDDVRNTVYSMLYLEVEEAFASKQPDRYNGWVPEHVDPHTGVVTPSHWLGESDLKAAEHQLTLAELRAKHASEAEQAEADAHVTACQDRLDECKAHVERMVAGYRHRLIDRFVAKRFLTLYRKAKALDWNLYDPSIPDNLRKYVKRQLDRGVGPVSLVFLYLVVTSTQDHGANFQTESLTTYDYLADNPLAVASLDIDVSERHPAVRKAYVRELRADAIRDRVAPAHPNLDPRDVLADFEYHGLPEQLGSMWIDKDHGCANCKQGIRTRIIHHGAGYRWATVCPNYQRNPNCHYDLKSPLMETRQQARDWAYEQLAQVA